MCCLANAGAATQFQHRGIAGLPLVGQIGLDFAA
jgi:hypothetical protein